MGHSALIHLLEAELLLGVIAGRALSSLSAFAAEAAAAASHPAG
jgi:hypothetical protein